MNDRAHRATEGVVQAIAMDDTQDKPPACLSKDLHRCKSQIHSHRPHNPPTDLFNVSPPRQLALLFMQWGTSLPQSHQLNYEPLLIRYGEGHHRNAQKLRPLSLNLNNVRPQTVWHRTKVWARVGPVWQERHANATETPCCYPPRIQFLLAPLADTREQSNQLLFLDNPNHFLFLIFTSRHPFPAIPQNPIKNTNVL